MTATTRKFHRWPTLLAWASIIAFGIFAMMLDANPSPSELDCNLRAAAARGDLAGLNRALARGAPVDAPDEVGTNALIEAARGGHRDIVDALINAGAQINRRTPVLGTPLMQAVINSQREVVQLLLERGADPEIRNEYGNDAAAFARSANDPVILKMLRIEQE